MHIEINDAKKIHDIQEQFSNRFAFLKLEFFSKPHEPEEASTEMPYLPEQTLGEISSKHISGVINVTAGQQITALEQEFRRRFDLNVQVYRLHLDRWIQTTEADALTLKELNDIARETAVFYNPDHKLTEDNF